MVIFQSGGKLLLQKSFSLKKIELEKVSESSSFLFLDKKKLYYI